MMRKASLVGAVSGKVTGTLFQARFPLLHRSSSSLTSTISINRVTKSNFDSALEDLRDHVRRADFVGLDLEMTGLTSAPWRDAFEFDRFDVRYLKVKDSAEKFAVVQFGVCPFRWDASRQLFVAHPYNFYIFPRQELPVCGPSHEFLCQTSSVDFLAKHQFDFNACIYEGISYLSREQEADALQVLASINEKEFDKLKDVREIPIESTFDLLFTERMKNKFREWLDGLLRNPGQIEPFMEKSDGPAPQLQATFFKLRPALMLNGFTSHQLRLIQLVIGKYFKDLTYVRVNNGSSSEQKFVVYTDSLHDKALLATDVRYDLQKEAQAKVKSAVGFRHVIDLLASEKKLMVGHNCLLDMAHIFNKFFGPLPSSIVEFAASVHESFPHIVDTKHLLKGDVIINNLMRNKSTSLSSAFALLCPHIAFTSGSTSMGSRPCVKIEVEADESRSSWNSGAKHEAGYDAFMTGCVFAQACAHLGVDFRLLPSSLILAKDEMLQTYMNHLYLGWNSGTLINLSTGNIIPELGNNISKKKYPMVIFSNIVLIWGFPPTLKPKDLKECVTKVFGLGSVASVYYLDESAAFIQFSKQEFVSEFLVLKDTLQRKNDPMAVLQPLSKLLEGNTQAADYEIYKQICTSPISKILFAEQAEAVGVKCRAEVKPSEVTETLEVSSNENMMSDKTLQTSVSDAITGRKINVSRDKSRHLSCEEILDTLYVAESLRSRRTKTL